MPALEMISGYATHPGAIFTAVTMSGSDSNSVRAFNQGTDKAFLMAQWGYTQVIGTARVRSPRMHDNVQGLRTQTQALSSDPQYWGTDFMQQLYAQDTLILETAAPTDAAGNFEYEALLLYYTNVPGIAAQLITPTQVQQKGMNVIGQYIPITTAATGGYTGSVAINSSVDNFKANEWYALVGGVVDTKCVAVRIQGADVGNVGVGFPGAMVTPSMTGRWFTELSNQYGLPLIPCFNSANKNAIFVSVAQDQGAAAVNVTLYLVEMGATITPGQ